MTNVNIHCDECLAQDVCMYRDIKVDAFKTEHPFLEVVCTRFIPASVKHTSKQQIITEWRLNNPDGKKIDCERETKISRPTVLKYWDTCEDRI